jgi:hypothetical protein
VIRDHATEVLAYWAAMAPFWLPLWVGLAALIIGLRRVLRCVRKRS